MEVVFILLAVVIIAGSCFLSFADRVLTLEEETVILRDTVYFAYLDKGLYHMTWTFWDMDEGKEIKAQKVLCPNISDGIFFCPSWVKKGFSVEFSLCPDAIKGRRLLMTRKLFRISIMANSEKRMQEITQEVSCSAKIKIKNTPGRQMGVPSRIFENGLSKIDH